jgi:hypothetical protein
MLTYPNNKQNEGIPRELVGSNQAFILCGKVSSGFLNRILIDAEGLPFQRDISEQYQA